MMMRMTMHKVVEYDSGPGRPHQIPVRIMYCGHCTELTCSGIILQNVIGLEFKIFCV